MNWMYTFAVYCSFRISFSFHRANYIGLFVKMLPACIRIHPLLVRVRESIEWMNYVVVYILCTSKWSKHFTATQWTWDDHRRGRTLSSFSGRFVPFLLYWQSRWWGKSMMLLCCRCQNIVNDYYYYGYYEQRRYQHENELKRCYHLQTRNLLVLLRGSSFGRYISTRTRPELWTYR